MGRDCSDAGEAVLDTGEQRKGGSESVAAFALHVHFDQLHSSEEGRRARRQGKGAEKAIVRGAKGRSNVCGRGVGEVRQRAPRAAAV